MAPASKAKPARTSATSRTAQRAATPGPGPNTNAECVKSRRLWEDRTDPEKKTVYKPLLKLVGAKRTRSDAVLSSGEESDDVAAIEARNTGVKKDEGEAIESTSRSKGKKRRVDHEEYPEAELDAEKVALKAENELLQQEVDKQRCLTDSFQAHLTCLVCLELLRRPFAIVPCGHTICYSCLIQWFCAVLPGQIDHGADDAAPAPNEDEALDAEVNRILGSKIALEGAFMNRHKKCPACRCAVTERPVEVYVIKALVEAVRGRGIRAEPTGGLDPWRNVFVSRVVAGGGVSPANPQAWAAFAASLQQAFESSDSSSSSSSEAEAEAVNATPRSPLDSEREDMTESRASRSASTFSAQPPENNRARALSGTIAQQSQVLIDWLQSMRPSSSSSSSFRDEMDAQTAVQEEGSEEEDSESEVEFDQPEVHPTVT